MIDWHAICARREPERFLSAFAADAARRPGEIAFVQDAQLASNPCLNPSVCPVKFRQFFCAPGALKVRPILSPALQLLRQHGFYLRQAHPATTNGPPLTFRQLLPILSLSSTPLHADLLIPAVGIEGVLDRPAADEPAWREKASRLYWRGSATGMQNEGRPVGETGARQRPWQVAHRPRLDDFANIFPSEGGENGDYALYADPLTGRPRWSPPLDPEAINGSQQTSRPADRPQYRPTSGGGWKARWLDIHLAAGRWWRLFHWWPEKGQQCSWTDGSCSTLA